MSSPIKRQNHRIHPCNAERKIELISHLISINSGKSILIVTSGATEELQKDLEGAKVMNDAEIAENPSLQYDVLISYDLPEKGLVYMARLARAKEYALIVLDAEDEKKLYPIELLLGRTIMQEVIAGFEPDFGIAVHNQQKAEAKAKREERDKLNEAKRSKSDTKERGKGSEHRRPASRNEDDGFRSKKQYESKPKFLDRDESTKPKSKSKSRDRNHYHDGTPRTEEEKASQSSYKSKPKFYGEKKEGTQKDFSAKKTFGDKKSPDDKKGFGEKKSFGDKKPYTDKRNDGGKKAYGEKKPYDKNRADNDKKGFGDKKPYGDKKLSASGPAKKTDAPQKRTGKRIDVKSFKPKEEKK